MKKNLLAFGLALALTSSAFCEDTKSVDSKEETTKTAENKDEATRTADNFVKDLEETSK